MLLINKRLAKFLNNPSGTRLSEIEYILFSYGFIKINAKGSHSKFKHSNLKRDLIIPAHGGDCKPFYKTLTAKILKELINNKNG